MPAAGGRCAIEAVSGVACRRCLCSRVGCGRRRMGGEGRMLVANVQLRGAGLVLHTLGCGVGIEKKTVEGRTGAHTNGLRRRCWVQSFKTGTRRICIEQREPCVQEERERERAQSQRQGRARTGCLQTAADELATACMHSVPEGDPRPAWASSTIYSTNTADNRDIPAVTSYAGKPERANDVGTAKLLYFDQCVAQSLHAVGWRRAAPSRAGDRGHKKG